ncbi:chorismate synthase [Kineothrix sp. MB12-C1]|uniref:chorismate synthase n=1 Tax=Kineothrix sp. MB12-C1 TaxID=3070215 RepID=UPI0027D21A2C|nr:chorismate synthase [Kineothrix sp. MB12-C1]WMC91829.1 chorismate synthase [Kineothrix sp. MB12-C1]
MSGSSFGNIFKITTWGESHGKGLGVVIDGCPAGLSLTEEDIQLYLDRRKPGQSRYTTKRGESDSVEILSGIFEGKTTGTPISLIVHNKDQHSADYSEIAQYYRPGHADLNYDIKYGFRDYRGGGRSSGRETIGRVAAGAIAGKILKQLGITLSAYTLSIGPVSIDKSAFDKDAIMQNPFYMPDSNAAEKAGNYLEQCMKEMNSSGGVIECVIQGMPAGIGSPVFEKLSANLGKAILSIGAVKGFEIGDGFLVSQATGLTNNDRYLMDSEGSIHKATNHSGGITGGMSDGCDIIFRAAIKPTPSIAASQQTVNKSGEDISINIKGRHDPVIVPRAVVVVEAMAALTVLDMLFLSMTAQMADIETFFNNK